MSEPLSAHEIEDVLSSIRRLVSEELRPVTKAEPAEAPAAALPPAAPETGAGASGAEEGKLLLTPSLRVVTPAAQAETPAPARPALLLSEPVLVAAPALPEEEVFFGEAAPLGTAGDSDIYDDAGLDQGGSGLQAVIDSLSVPQDAPAGEAEFAADFASAIRGGEPEEAAAPLVATGPAVIAAGLPDIDWMQDGAFDEPDEPAAFIAYPRSQTESARQEADPVAADPLARAWADRAEAEVHASLKEAQPVGSDPAPAIFDPEEAILDEDLLRDIVREMIREELAGTLGERITRNVRKLVRLEVNRALTSRDLE